MTVGQIAWLADEYLKSGKITKTAYNKIMNTEIVPYSLVEKVSEKACDIEWERVNVYGFKYTTTTDMYKQGRASAGEEISALIDELERELYKENE